MSKQISVFTVVLKEDISEEHAKKISNAILMFDGVISVGRHEPDPMDYVARERARQEIGEKLFAIIYPKSK